MPRPARTKTDCRRGTRRETSRRSRLAWGHSPTAVTEIYRDADLLIFPTRYEAFPLVVIEAMAAGLPVIVSDSVPTGIVTDGRNGVVIAGQDPAEYAVALRRLADPQIRAKMSEANRQDVCQFSVKPTVEDYASVIESFVEIQ